jgi:5-methylcytosine-specific restriction endonuclease McrA
MPLPKLQRVGSDVVEFLYRIPWGDNVRRSDFNSDDFDNLIRFVGQAGDHLLRLAPLIRPLVQREWTSLVARFNGLPEAELERFLFGARREAIAHLAAPLGEVQEGRCFYCDTKLGASSQVDHFMAWRRHPDDGLDNLVVAHAPCNLKKRDHLAATEHVERWRKRDHKALAGIAADSQWQRDPERTLGVARSIYLRLPADALLWQLDHRFVRADPRRLTKLFGPD